MTLTDYSSRPKLIHFTGKNRIFTNRKIMKIPQTLRRPSNWQDFETLCMVLWEEIWQCPEIKKNGRPGQAQDGVDIYGIPKGEEHYFGIQCKGKSEYNNAQFSEQEIVDEIEKAKKSSPSLKKLYLTTTAQKDVHIEKFVREIDTEHRRLKLFEVHLFSWEDIVEKIDRTQNCKNWYLSEQGYQNSYAASISFSNFETEIIARPKFKKKKTVINQKIVPADPNNGLAAFFHLTDTMRAVQSWRTENAPKLNRSYMPINLLLKNTGVSALESCKILFQFDGEIQDFRIKKPIEDNMDLVISTANFHPHEVKYNIATKSGVIQPKTPTIVGDDTLNLDTFYIKPFPEESTIILKWKFLSKYYKTDGELKLIITPEVKTEYVEELSEDPLQKGTVHGPIEDYFEVITK
jgi:hypothetical protein